MYDTDTNVVDEVLEAEERLEAEEAELASLIDESLEDPSLESSTPTERDLIDDESAVVASEDDDLPGVAGVTNIDKILGVPLFYERTTSPGPRSFPVANSFRPILDTIVRETQARVPPQFGALQRITSAGMFVAKPGAHGQGRGCDWDRLVFANAQIAPLDRDHASSSLAKRMRYWAFGAICRSTCAFVLHGLYDAAHGDHFHTDNLTGVAFNRNSEATVKLLQAVLNDIHGHTPKLATDGDFGPLTSGAFTRAMGQLQLSGSIDNVEVWRKFLRRSARLGFARSLTV